MADNPNYPIATSAINWVDSNGQVHLRLYSTDGYNISEFCFDGQDWVQGQFSAPGSAVSATCWPADGGVSIRVYATSQDVTTEYCADPGGSWVQGHVFP